MRKWITSVAMLLLLSAIFMYGCYRHQTAVRLPLRIMTELRNRSDTLIVMLPGRGGSMKDFEKRVLQHLHGKKV